MPWKYRIESMLAKIFADNAECAFDVLVTIKPVVRMGQSYGMVFETCVVRRR